MDQHRRDLSAREATLLRGLARRRAREQEGRFLAEGVRVVEDLLASTLTTEWLCVASALEDSPRGAALLAGARDRGLPVRVLSERDFQPFAATEHSQGVLAVARIPEPAWGAVLATDENAVMLVLDGVQDPGNVGTLARTAEALGVAAIIALPGTVDPWNAKAVRAAAGSLFRVPVLAGAWGGVAGRLRTAGFRLLGADAQGEPVAGVGGRVALVVGNEGAGLSAEVRGGVDGMVAVPIRGRAESLNVAAAAAILLYELTR